MAKFDISLAFDKAEYLNPQIYLFFNSIKYKLPEDTTIHIVTNRNFDKDPIIEFIKDTIPGGNLHFYYQDPFKDLKSRCQYMFHSFEVSPRKEWIIKMELDTIALKNLSIFEELTTKDYDIYITPESRKMISDDNLESRIWKMIYKNLGIDCPKETISYIEGNSIGLPLYDTSTIMVRKKWINYINQNWVPMTRICEKWINMNIHPNEFAFTALIHKSGMKCNLLDKKKYDFNPISHFREGQFPNQKLINNPIVPKEVILLQYHRPWWLKQLCDSNLNIKEIVDKSLPKIGDKWLDSSVDTTQFQEK